MQLGRVSEGLQCCCSNCKSRIRNKESTEIEAETRHDIMALTKAMAEAAGDAGWCIHLGATSNDIVDTAVALQLRDSIVLLREQLCLLIGVALMLQNENVIQSCLAELMVKLRYQSLSDQRHSLAWWAATSTDSPRWSLTKNFGWKIPRCSRNWAAQGEHARITAVNPHHLGLGVPCCD